MEAKAALTAALKDLGRRHLWQEVFSQFEYFRRQHGDPGAAACAALTGACGRARRWELALDLLEEDPREPGALGSPATAPLATRQSEPVSGPWLSTSCSRLLWGRLLRRLPL
ncbi:unnamed protein product [Polarella glacialis]|uniref:Uncharacterized protein n=1 Tax=Polarella glacialis TaxID=89957 RepID=A0A813GMK0_POLGL|nr:unnamed protein product [Polarella glacialis]